MCGRRACHGSPQYVSAHEVFYYGVAIARVNVPATTSGEHGIGSNAVCAAVRKQPLFRCI